MAHYPSLPLHTLLLKHYPTSSPTTTPILIIYLNRPSARNAFTDTMADELEYVFDLIAQDDMVKCVIVTGGSEGGAFCAGADLKDGGGLGLGDGTGAGDGEREHRDG